MADYQAEADKLRAESQNLYRSIGETGKDFLQMYQSAVRADELTKKTKELIALAIAVAQRCEGSMVIHVKAAVEAGATHAEIAEAVGVAVAMGGGPAVVYGGKALDCADQFLEQAQD